MAPMFTRGGFGMWKVTILVLMAALPAASQRVSVDQLQRTLTTLRAAKTSDGAMAQAISPLELTEHLTNPTLDRMKAEFKPGPKTLLSLEFLSYSSSFLDPPPAELPDRAPPDAAADLSMMSAAKNFAATTLRHMPNFVATRITRSFDNSSTPVSRRGAPSPGLQLMGIVSREITYRDGRETVLEMSSVTNFKSNRVESVWGLTSQGEFGPILATVLDDTSNGRATWSHWENTAAGSAAVFHYQVPEGASHYQVKFCCENEELPDFPGSYYHGTPAYHGSLYVDPITGAVLRMTLEAELDPTEPIMRAAISVDYGSVDIGGKRYICPVQSVAISSTRRYLAKEARDTTIRRLNEVVFTNYHRFGSSIRMLATPPTP